MYNGIGLATVRGSATSGHVTKNLSYVKPEFFRRKVDSNANIGQQHRQGYTANDRDSKPPRQSADKDILEHNRKRELEAKIFEIRETMTEQGYSEEEIQERVNKLTQGSHHVGQNRSGFSTDTHELIARKEEENTRLAKAFGMNLDGIQ